MPIYAYRCNACGHAKDVLQKLSDPVLTTCPACGADAFSKQVTAAGFQLKGSGWYVTDFRDGGGKKDSKKDGAGDKADAADKTGAATESATPAPAAAPATPTGAASSASAPAPAPAAGSGGG